MSTDTEIPTEEEIASRSYDWGHEKGDFLPAAHPEFKRRQDSKRAHEKRMAALTSQAQDLREKAKAKEEEADALAVEDDPQADALYDKADDLRTRAKRIERKVEAKQSAFEPSGLSVEAAKDEQRYRAQARRAELYEEELIPAVRQLEETLEEIEGADADMTTASGKSLLPSHLKIKAPTGSQYESLRRYREDLEGFVERHG
jgi:predicted  nucleic acid-binding Zn-ribbon protein